MLARIFTLKFSSVLGGFYGYAQGMRSADRNYARPSYRFYYLGLRLLRQGK